MGAFGVVGMGVGQEEAIDDGGVDAIARDLVDDRLSCVWGVSRTGIDDHSVVAGRDQEDVTIVSIGEVEAKTTAADEMDVLGEFQWTTSS